MTTKTNCVNLNSLNTRGLGDKIKRRSIFQWIKQNHKGITFLQETHSTKVSEEYWKREWKGHMFFSHGTSGSRGVAIIFPQNIDLIVHNIITDEHGRFLLLEVTIDDSKFVLVNIYAPTKDKHDEQERFIGFIKETLNNYIDGNIIIGGDFNTCLDPAIDKDGGLHEKVSEYSKQIIELNDEFNLIDIWRISNPDTRRYTWRGLTRQGRVFSRLDFWLISAHMIYDLIKTDISPSIKTDHSIITLTFELNNTCQKGKGFWKFNAELLKDQEYITKINTLIEICKIENAHLENKALLWDFIKCKIRGETISYSSYKSKVRRAHETKLNEKLLTLEKEFDKNLTTAGDVKHEYDLIKQEIEEINEIKSRGFMLRSKAKWVEDGEKCTKFFMQLENRNYKSKYIKSLNWKNNILRDPNDILSAQQDFYVNLYTEQVRTNSCDNNCSLFNTKHNKLSQIELELCDKNIVLAECSKSLSELPNNKSPGSDGFTTEFYKFFWKSLGTLVLDSFNYSFINGELSLEQRRAILTLLPKPNKDSRELKNWRPISLLNTDYKILTKLLANRLQNVITNIVSEDQTGYIKSRYIGENVRSIIDILEYTAYRQNPGLMIFLDFEKAFDTISWQFLFKTLKYFNFGDEFIKWIRLLYNKPLACVTNNGYATEFFQISRGIRQGCPISALLFILVVEIMSINLKNNKSIHGISLNNKEILITQLADDTTLFLKNIESFKTVNTVLEHFYQCAGLRLNKDKTEVLPLGLHNYPNLDSFGLKEVTENVKSLGIILSKNTKNIVSNNFSEKIMKLKNLLNMWKSRQLSIKGKITLLRSQALPLILYPASVLYTPPEVIKEIDQIFFDFIWPNKKHHVKKKVLIQSIEDGGLKMPDIETTIKAIKLTWIKRLITKNNNYTKIANANSHIDNFNTFFDGNMKVEHMLIRPSPFYEQLIEYWHEIRDLEQPNCNQLLNEPLWLNHNILIGNKPAQQKEWEDKGINILNDILNENGSFKTCNHLQLEYNLNIDIMKYNSLITAIPKGWLKLIRETENRVFELIEKKSIKIGKKIKKLEKLKCKEFYWQLISKNYTRPTALGKWEENYYYANFKWNDIFILPYQTARETSLQSLQFKIINRFLPCRSNINKWYSEEDKNCVLCSTEETIEHLLFWCDEVKLFWSCFQRWWENIHNCNINLGCLDILFGIINDNKDTMIHVLNYCILFAKNFIVKCKSQHDACDFNQYCQKLKYRIDVERQIAVCNDQFPKFIREWSFIYQN